MVVGAVWEEVRLEVQVKLDIGYQYIHQQSIHARNARKFMFPAAHSWCSCTART